MRYAVRDARRCREKASQKLCCTEPRSASQAMGNRLCLSKSGPAVLVMQSAQNWPAQNAPGGLDSARYRRILVQ